MVSEILLILAFVLFYIVFPLGVLIVAVTRLADLWRNRPAV